ncbi:MAG: hypothetical protein Q7U47_14070 [Paludibacter sp.]|nr:hypothetical protein [Paludibacter sp.]
MNDYAEKLSQLRYNIDNAIKENQPKEEINTLRFDYNILRKKMMKAYEDLVHLNTKTIVDLSKFFYLFLLRV